MSEQRIRRKEVRAQHNDPINVTIIEEGIRKVITFKQYQEFLNPKKEAD